MSLLVAEFGLGLVDRGLPFGPVEVQLEHDLCGLVWFDVDALFDGEAHVR